MTEQQEQEQEQQEQERETERTLRRLALRLDVRRACFPEWEQELAYCTPEMSLLTQHYRLVSWALRDAQEHMDDLTDADKDALQGRVDDFLAHAAQVGVRMDEQSVRMDEQSAARCEQLARADAAWQEVNAALDDLIALLERAVAKPAGDEVH